MNFGKFRYFFLMKLNMSYTDMVLLITPILVLLSIPISYYLFILNTKILDDFKNTNKPLYSFLLNKWYIDEIYEKIFVNPTKK